MCAPLECATITAVLRAVFACVLLFAATACSPVLSIDIGGAPGAVILAFSSDDPNDLEVYAFAGSAAATHESLLLADRDRFTVTVLSYRSTLEELRLPDGRLAAAAADVSWRPLPPFDTARRAQIDGDDRSAWSDLPAPADASSLGEPLAGFRIEELSAAECADQHGCFVDHECRLPCPKPSDIRAPMGPADPAPPELTPCADGWIETPTGDVVECVPPSQPDAIACADDEAQFFGASACTSVGAACGATEFAPDLPTGLPIIYVRPGSSPSPQEAIDGAVGPTVVALARGSFDNEITLRDGVVLFGACAAETRIDAVLFAGGGTAEVHRVRAGGTNAAIRVLAGSTLVIDSVIVEGTDGYGLIAAGGSTLFASALLVRDRPVGVVVYDGARAELDHSVLRAIGGIAIDINQAGTRLRLTNAAVRGATIGVRVAESATAAIDRAAIEEIREVGVQVLGSDARASIDRAIVRGVGPMSIGILSQGSVSVARSVLTDSGTNQIVTHDSGELSIADSWVASSTTNAAINVHDAVSVRAHRTSILSGGSGGLSINDSGTAELGDLVFGTVPGDTGAGKFGTSLRVRNVRAATMERILVTATRSLGIDVHSVATNAVLSDIAMRDSAAGLSIIKVSELSLDRARFERIRGTALGVLDLELLASRIDLRDVAVVDTMPDAESRAVGVRIQYNEVSLARVDIKGTRGTGMFLSRYSTTDVVDLLIDDADDAALRLDLGAHATIDGALVRTGTIAVQAGASTVVSGNDIVLEGSSEVGLLVPNSARVSFERFRIRDIAGTGVQILPGGEADLTDGELSRSAIGAGVFGSGLDPVRLFDRVVFTDNGINFQ